MADGIKDEILYDHNHDGIDRRGFLKCMAWAGTGALCVIQGGVLKSYGLSRLSEMSGKDAKGLRESRGVSRPRRKEDQRRGRK